MFVLSQGPLPAVGSAFPDALIVVLVVVPFENVSLSPTAIPTCYNVFTMCMPNHNLPTRRAVTITGAGLAVTCGGDFLPGGCLLGSFTLFVGGPPATKMTMPTLQNLINAFGFNISPSQIVWLALS
jgi:hypothetical protein